MPDGPGLLEAFETRMRERGIVGDQSIPLRAAFRQRLTERGILVETAPPGIEPTGHGFGEAYGETNPGAGTGLGGAPTGPDGEWPSFAPANGEPLRPVRMRTGSDIPFATDADPMASGYNPASHARFNQDYTDLEQGRKWVIAQGLKPGAPIPVGMPMPPAARRYIDSVLNMGKEKGWNSQPLAQGQTPTQIAYGLARGVPIIQEQIGGAQATLGRMVGSPAITQAGENWMGQGRQQANQYPAPQGFVGKLAESVPSALASVGAGVATAGLGVVPAIAAGVGTAGIQSGGSQYADAQGRMIQAGATPDQAGAIAAPEAVGVGAFSALTSVLPMGQYLAKVAPNAVGKFAAKIVGNSTGGRLLGMAVAEGSQEASEQLSQMFMQHWAEDDPGAYKDFWSQIGQAAAGGALLGPLMGGAVEAPSLGRPTRAPAVGRGSVSQPPPNTNQPNQTGEQQQTQDAGPGSQAGNDSRVGAMLDALRESKPKEVAAAMASEDPGAALRELLAKEQSAVSGQELQSDRGRVQNDAENSTNDFARLLGPADDSAEQVRRAREARAFDAAREEERRGYMALAGEQDQARSNADFLAENQGVERPGTISGDQPAVPEQGLEARMRAMPLDDLRALSERLTGFRTGARPALMMRVRRAVAEGRTENGRQDTANRGGERAPGAWPEIYGQTERARPVSPGVPTQETTDVLRKEEGQEDQGLLNSSASLTGSTPAPAAGGSVDAAVSKIRSAKDRAGWVSGLVDLAQSMPDGTSIADDATGVTWTRKREVNQRGTETISFTSDGGRGEADFSFQRKPGGEWNVLGEPVFGPESRVVPSPSARIGPTTDKAVPASATPDQSPDAGKKVEGAKEPWEQTREEYGHTAIPEIQGLFQKRRAADNGMERAARRGDNDAVDTYRDEWGRLGDQIQSEIARLHRASVEAAIAAGKIESHPDYPDLSKSAPSPVTPPVAPSPRPGKQSAPAAGAQSSERAGATDYKAMSIPDLRAAAKARGLPHTGMISKVRAGLEEADRRDAGAANAKAITSGARKHEQTDTIAGTMNLDEFEKAGYSPDEVTRSEWVAMQRANRRYLGQSENAGTQYAPNADDEEYHKDAVKRAMAKGDEVDERVLKDYPELVKKVEAKPESKPLHQMTRDEAGDVVVRKYAAMRTPTTPMHETLRAMEEKGNGKGYNPDHLTDERLAAARAAKYVVGPPKKPRMSDEGRSALREMDQRERSEGLRNGSDFDREMDAAMDAHKAAVAKAIDDGTTVSDAVLEDYSDLWKKAKAKPAPKQEAPKPSGVLANLSPEKQARAEELKRKIAAKLHNELRSGFDPEMFAAGVELTSLYVESGLKRFNAFARQMVADLGDGIKPYLKSFYNGARSFPGVDSSQMDAAADVEGMDVDAAAQPDAKPEPKTQEPKEPWQMSRAEHLEEWKKGGWPTEPAKQTAVANEAEFYHEAQVRRAIAAGKIDSHPDYPNLSKADTKKPEAPTAAGRLSDKAKARLNTWLFETRVPTTAQLRGTKGINYITNADAPAVLAYVREQMAQNPTDRQGRSMLPAMRKVEAYIVEGWPDADVARTAEAKKKTMIEADKLARKKEAAEKRMETMRRERRSPAEFRKAKIEADIIALAKAMPDPILDQSIDWNGDIVPIGDISTRFYKKLPTEILGEIDAEPQLRTMFSVTEKTSESNGADWLSTLDAIRPGLYMDVIRAKFYSGEGRNNMGLEAAKRRLSRMRNQNAEADFAMWLHEKITELGNDRPDWEIADPATLDDGTTMQIAGEKFTVEVSEYGVRSLTDGVTIYAGEGAVTKLPVDKGTIVAPPADHMEVGEGEVPDFGADLVKDGVKPEAEETELEEAGAFKADDEVEYTDPETGTKMVGIVEGMEGGKVRVLAMLGHPNATAAPLLATATVKKLDPKNRPYALDEKIAEMKAKKPNTAQAETEEAFGTPMPEYATAALSFDRLKALVQDLGWSWTNSVIRTDWEDANRQGYGPLVQQAKRYNGVEGIKAVKKAMAEQKDDAAPKAADAPPEGWNTGEPDLASMGPDSMVKVGRYIVKPNVTWGYRSASGEMRTFTHKIDAQYSANESGGAPLLWSRRWVPSKEGEWMLVGRTFSTQEEAIAQAKEFDERAAKDDAIAAERDKDKIEVSWDDSAPSYRRRWTRSQLRQAALSPVGEIVNVKKGPATISVFYDHGTKSLIRYLDRSYSSDYTVHSVDPAEYGANFEWANTPTARDIRKTMEKAAKAAEQAAEAAAAPGAPIHGNDGTTAPAAGDDLASRGIKIVKTTTKNGNPVWEVTGNTWDHRATLKGLGAKWYGPKKSWSFYGSDPTAKIAQALGASAPTPVAAGGDGGIAQPEPGPRPDSAGDLARQRLRQQLDGAADDRASGADYAGKVEATTAELIRKGLKYGIPEDVVQGQIEDVGAIVKAFEQDKKLFILGNDAGSGKTFVLGGAIRDILATGKTKRAIYVTMNQDLIEQIKDNLKEYGIGKVEFATYADLSNKAGEIDTTGALLILDESHKTKNVESKSGVEGAAMVAKAAFTIYSSATPYENPVQAGYLAPTGLFNEVGGHVEWAKIYGAAVRKRKVYNPKTGRGEIEEEVYWISSKEAAQNAKAAKRWLEKKGVFVQRPIKLNPAMVEASFTKVTADPEMVTFYEEVDEAYEAALAQWRDHDGKPINPITFALIAMHQANARKRILEASKIKAAIASARKHLADGKKIAIFIETKAERHFGRYRKSNSKPGSTLYTYAQMEEMMREWETEKALSSRMGDSAGPPPFNQGIMSIARAMNAAGIDQTIPSVMDELAAEFGDAAALYTGAQTSAEAVKGREAWKRGDKKVLIVTMDKGGTGLSLHDMKGDQPTVQINLNLPWTATKVKQVNARTARYGLASKVILDWLFTNQIPFDRMLASRVGGRIRDMGATVSGINIPASDTLTDWNFEDKYDATGMTLADRDAVEGAVETTPEEEAAEAYRKADRLERSRSKQADTSGGFFETPHPVALFMARIAGIKPTDVVLEPSAGHGMLLKYLPANGGVYAVEQNHERSAKTAAMMKASEHAQGTMRQGDWPDVADSLAGKYDVVLMNPPFERIAGKGWQDMAHVRLAYEGLKDNGRLVSILSTGFTFRDDNQSREFRDWLSAVGATVIKLPEDAFKQSGTGVRTAMVVIDKGGNTAETNDLEVADFKGLRDLEDDVPARVSEQNTPPEAPKPPAPPEPTKTEEDPKGVWGVAKNDETGIFGQNTSVAPNAQFSMFSGGPAKPEPKAEPEPAKPSADKPRWKAGDVFTMLGDRYEVISNKHDEQAPNDPSQDWIRLQALTGDNKGNFEEYGHRELTKWGATPPTPDTRGAMARVPWKVSDKIVLPNNFRFGKSMAGTWRVASIRPDTDPRAKPGAYILDINRPSSKGTYGISSETLEEAGIEPPTPMDRKESELKNMTPEERQERYPGIRGKETVAEFEKRMGLTDTPGMFGPMSIPQLRAEAERRGVKSTGAIGTVRKRLENNLLAEEEAKGLQTSMREALGPDITVEAVEPAEGLESDLATFLERMGQTPVFLQIDGTEAVEGIVLGRLRERIYLAAGQDPVRLAQNALHELMHSSRAQNPDLNRVLARTLGEQRIAAAAAVYRRDLVSQFGEGSEVVTRFDEDADAQQDEGIARSVENMAIDPEVRAAMLARPGLWARLKRWVRAMLEKAGFGSDTDRLRTAVLKVLDGMEKGGHVYGGSEEGVRYSVKPGDDARKQSNLDAILFKQGYRRAIPADLKPGDEVMTIVGGKRQTATVSSVAGDAVMGRWNDAPGSPEVLSSGPSQALYVETGTVGSIGGARLSAKRGGGTKPDAPVNIRDAAAVATLAASRALYAKVSKGKKLTDIIRAILADPTFTKIPDSVKTEQGVKKVQRLARAIMADAGPDGTKWAQALATVEAERNRLDAIKTDTAVAKRFKAKDAEALSAKLGEAQKRAGAMSAVEQRAFEESRTEANKRVSNIERIVRDEMRMARRAEVAFAGRQLADLGAASRQLNRSKDTAAKQMTKLEARASGEAAEAAGKAKRDTADGIRAEAVRIIRDQVPRTISGRYLEAVRDATTLGRLTGLIGRVRMDLANYELRNRIREAKRAISRANPEKMLEQHRALVNEAKAELARIRGTLKQLKSVAEKLAAAEELRAAAGLAIEARHRQKADQEVRVGNKVKQREDLVGRGTAALAKRKQIKRDPGLSETQHASMMGRMHQANLTPDTVGAMMGDADLNRLISEDFWDGETAVHADRKRAMDALKKMLERAGYEWGSDRLANLSRAASGRRADVLTLKLPNAGSVDATPGEWMGLYATATDAGAREEILDRTGITWSRDKRMDPILLTVADLDALESQLPETLRSVVLAAKRYIEKRVRPGVFRAYREQTGHDLIPVDFYWPTHRNYVQPPPERLINTSSGQVRRALEKLGFLKEREGGRMPYLINDFFKEFHDHTFEAAAVTHMTRRVRSAENVFKDPRMQKAIEGAFGDGMNREIGEIIEAAKLITQVPRTMSEQATAWLKRNFAKAVLLLNPKTWMKQIGGVFKLLTAKGLSLKHWTAGVGRMFSAEVSKILSDGAYFRDRYEDSIWRRVTPALGERVPLLGESGALDAGLRLVMGAKTPGGPLAKAWGQVASRYGAMSDLIDRITILNWFDSLSARVAIAGKLAQAEAENVPEESRRRWVEREAEYLMRRTQNGHSSLEQSSLARRSRGDLLGAFLMFTSDSTKTYNMVARAWQGDKEDKAKALVALALNALWAMIVGGLSTLLFKRDPEKAMAAAARELGNNTLGLAYGGSAAVDAVSAFGRALTGQPVWHGSNVATAPMFRSVEQLEKGIQIMVKGLGSEGTFRTGPRRGQDRRAAYLWEGGEKAALAATDILGIPISPLYRMGKDLMSNGGEYDGSWK